MVGLILEKLAAGETIDQLLQAHPRLTKDAVLAALAYAVKVANNTCNSAMCSIRLSAESWFLI